VIRLALAAFCLLAAAGCGDPPDPPAAKPAAETAAKPRAAQPVRRLDEVPAPEFVGERGTGAEIDAGDLIAIHYISWAITPEGDRRFGGSVPAEWTGTRRAFDPLPADPDARNAAPRPLVTEAGRAHVVDGLDRALLQLRVGDHAKVVVPSDLAYGDRGYPPVVPPRADIRYEIWVLRKIPPVTWEVLAKGDGPQAQLGRPLLIHTKVTLPDGSVVDDTKRPKKGSPEGQPTAILLNGANPSEILDRILPQLRVGDRVRFTAPWELDLGPEPRKYEGVAIPAMTDITYEVDVVFLPPAAPAIAPATDDAPPEKDTEK
jgi:peptidylprolyl isomerase